MNDWRDFKKSFTQRQEDALWQYLIDHANVQSTGLFKILFHVRDVDDFWRRVYARYTGEFKRYEKLEKQHENEMLNIHVTKKMARRMNEIFLSIERQGSFFDKIVLWVYRKSRNYIERYDGGTPRMKARKGSTSQFLKSLKTS